MATFAEGLDVTADDVLLYLALREAAHQRLFAHVPWLREHLIGAVADYARGIEINAEGMQSRIEEQMRGIDPMNPESMQGLLDGGLFDLPQSPAQEAALQRLEVTLALVEGWVDEVVGQATAERMPAATKMQEAVRRRRAAGGPAEETFATLVGLELRPRRLRDASTLWGSLRTRQGTEARDGVWMHPDLLPTAADLDDPLGFREDAAAPESMSEDDFDAALRDLLDGGGTPDAPHRSEPARRRARGPHRLGAAHAGPGRAARAVRRAPAGPSGRHVPSVPSGPPDREHAGPDRGRQPGAAHAAREGAARGSSSAATASPATARWSRPPVARRPRSPASPAWCSTRSRCSSASTRCRSAARTATSTTSTCGSSPWRPRPGCTRSARSRSTCAGGPPTRCPTPGPTWSSWSRWPGRGWLSPPS